jgi:hypothetical protein
MRMEASRCPGKLFWEDIMQATVGDQLVIRSNRTGEVDRHGEITEVHGENGAPPYLVHWSDGHETVLFPSSDAVVEHRNPTA